jgi:hypothetical protein
LIIEEGEPRHDLFTVCWLTGDASIPTLRHCLIDRYEPWNIPMPRHQGPKPLIVWERGETICIARSFASDDIEITISADGAIIERQRFKNLDAAAMFTIQQMRRA